MMLKYAYKMPHEGVKMLPLHQAKSILSFGGLSGEPWCNLYINLCIGCIPNRLGSGYINMEPHSAEKI